jgi:hypothetical protein
MVPLVLLPYLGKPYDPPREGRLSLYLPTGNCDQEK